MRHRHMRDATRSEKALRPRKGAIDELVDDDEIAGLQVLTQAANGGERYDVGHTAAFQRIDIGAKIDFGGRQHVTAPVARHEDDRLTIERPEAEFVGCPTKGAFYASPFDIREPVDLVEPAAPDDADYWASHPRFNEPAPRSCASSRRRLRRRQSRKEL